MAIHFSSYFRDNCRINRCSNTYYSRVYFQGTSQNNPFFRERNKGKKKIIDEKIEQHHEDIFNMYQQWIDTGFLIDIDLRNFDVSKLFVNIIEQLAPKHVQTVMNMTTIQDKSISHLNCDDYRSVYEKFDEIKNLQERHNTSMKTFLDRHRNCIKEIVNNKNFNATEESINMFLRFIFIKSREYKKRPSAVGWKLDDFGSFAVSLDDVSEERLDISNPFPEKEMELIDHLKKNYDDIIESIEIFENNLKNIVKSMQEFKNMIQLIVDNKTSGLKGECDFEKFLMGKSNSNKIISFFHRCRHFVSK